MRTDPQRLEQESRLERPGVEPIRKLSTDTESRVADNGVEPHSMNGHAGVGAANGVNGHGAVTEGPTVRGRRLSVVRVAEDERGLATLAEDSARLDWDSFLPPRASGPRWRMAQRVKRLFDLVLASVGILILLPFFIAVAFLVKVTSRGPVFYTCDYVGRRGRRFVGYKFRTMVENAEALKDELNHLNHMKGPAFKIRDDPRVTAIGRLLRKFSIDELPQLWNVVRGEMSLVGPRPPLPEEWRQFEDWQRGKLSVIPGITCYWQVGGRSEITDFDEWARLDLRYIQEWSLWTDLKVLLRTVPAVVLGRGAY